jgi:predicted enzyme related to lactoylglutathione lyase
MIEQRASEWVLLERAVPPLSFNRVSGYLKSSALAIMLGAALAASTASAAGYEFPALSQPATKEHHAGKVIWADLVTPDLDGARKFYGELFGWTFHDVRLPKTDSAVAYINDRPVAGLVHREMTTDQQRQPAWLTYIAVGDVKTAKQVALAHGAKVLSDVRSYPKRGQQAIFADPQGAVFAVLASSSGDPVDDLADPGEWIWSSLIAKDTDAEATFYQQIFGYEVFDASDDDDDQTDNDHFVLSTDDYARASVNPLSAKSTSGHAHWTNFIRVANVTDSAAKAVSLGGKILIPPHVDRSGGQIAIIADPSGAPVGLMEWSETAKEEAAK